MVKMICAALSCALSLALGGADALLVALIVLTILDFMTGIIKGVMTKSLSSGVMWHGGFRKILIYMVVALAVMTDRAFGGTQVVRGLTIGYYISTEGLSILENVTMCGVPLPVALQETLKNIKEHGGEK